MERAACEPLGPSPDRQVSTAYWRYLAHRKLGEHEAAQSLVDQIPRDLEMIENHTYYQSVLFFQGFRTEESLLPEVDSIIRFAIAMVQHFEGQTDLAEQMWHDIVADSAQGFWPAEAELVLAVR